MVNFKTFDLNLLRVLNALLETGSTVRAAQRLNMSQPAVSAALGRLRHALDDPLFVRQGRQLTPTLFALSLHHPLSEILIRTESLLNGPEGFDPATADMSFKISGSDFFAEFLMPPLADHLSRVAPNIRVQLLNLMPNSYAESLNSLDVDVALIPETEVPNWAQQEVLFTSQFCVVARKGHARLQHANLSPGDIVPLDLFCDLGHVLFSPDGNLRAMVDQELDKAGRTRRVVMSLPVFSGVYNAVAASDLVAVIPQSLPHRMAPRIGLDIYLSPIPLPMARLSMIWHQRRSHSAAHCWILDQLRSILRPLDDSDEPA
ncbi:LysR family transcriptional regulator [Thalassovita sp.]|jgi:DNA-binding transcriptional LysR family regulator|uniref:LysR family transcriptional regulator n=1 Tax=Thalassovita sp. TaxID=1979401 RepID=UPI003B5A4BCC